MPENNLENEAMLEAVTPAGKSHEEEDQSTSLKSLRSDPTRAGSIRTALSSLKKKLSSPFVSSFDRSVLSSTCSATQEKTLEEEVEQLNLAPPKYKCIFEPHHFEMTRVANQRKEWALNMVSVLHNGLLMELNDIYLLFSILEKRPLQLDIHDINLVFKWYNQFCVILENFFDIDEVCLYEWIEGRDLLEKSKKLWNEPEDRIKKGKFCRSRREKRRGVILHIMRNIVKYEKNFGGKPILQVLPGFANLFEEFVKAIEGFVKERETGLVEIIEERRERKDLARYELRFWTKTRDCDENGFTMIAMMRWMNKKERKYWTAKMRSLKIADKSSIGEWLQNFDKEHYGVVKECEVKLKAAVDEKKLQIEIHENARQRAVLKSKLSFIAVPGSESMKSGNFVDPDHDSSCHSNIIFEESRLTSLVSN